MTDAYDVVFTGRLRPGADPDAVLEAFSRQFDIGPDTARAMLAAESELVVRSGVTVADANRLRDALQTLGMSVVLRPLGEPAPEPADGLELVPKSGGENAAPPVVHGHPLNAGVLCPKCATRQAPSDVCINCGLVFEKYYHQAAREEDIGLGAEPVSARQPAVRPGGLRLVNVLLFLLVLALGVAAYLYLD